MSYYVPVTAWIPAYSWSLYVFPSCSSALPPPASRAHIHVYLRDSFCTLVSVETSWPG